MSPCTGSFSSITAPKRLQVTATSTDRKAVFSLTVVVLPREHAELVHEHFTFSRTALESGAAAWDLDPGRVYRLALLADRAVSLAITIDLPNRRILDSTCSSVGPGIVGLWTLPTRTVTS